VLGARTPQETEAKLSFATITSADLPEWITSIFWCQNEKRGDERRWTGAYVDRLVKLLIENNNCRLGGFAITKVLTA
jgi:hypothetical protein